jgi:hypothetical protein
MSMETAYYSPLIDPLLNITDVETSVSVEKSHDIYRWYEIIDITEGTYEQNPNCSSCLHELGTLA